MGISEEERNELIELENQVAILIDEIKEYRDKAEDGDEKRKMLVRAQLELGKKSRRLKYLNSLI